MPLQLTNATPFTAGCYPLTTRRGATFLRVVVKGGFDILGNGGLQPSAVQPPIVLEDQYWGEPAASSVRYESDLILAKPGCDLVIHGQACAPSDRPVTRMAVGLSYCGRQVKALQVTGDRHWQRGPLGLSLSSPRPFLRMDIVYDRAYGGVDDGDSEARNRVGMGYATKSSRLDGKPVPNIEYPDQLITSTSDHPAPAGFGVVAKNWMPRMAYAGTYDDAWLEEQFPLLPDDFDERFFHSVPEDQWIALPRGGEEIVVRGMRPEGDLAFALPNCIVPACLRYASGDERRLMSPETVLVDTLGRCCIITWSADADIHGDPFRLKEVVIGAGAAGTPKCCSGT
jgi:hypothetical protein